MIEKCEDIDVDHFAFDYFKRNDHQKCIEISNANCIVPVDRFFLYIDHTDCSPQCFVVGFSISTRLIVFIKITKIAERENIENGKATLQH